MLTYVWLPFQVSHCLVTFYFCLFGQTLPYWLNYLLRETWICGILVIMSLWNAISIVQFSYVMDLAWIHGLDVEKSGKRLGIILAITVPTVTQVIQVYLVSFIALNCPVLFLSTVDLVYPEQTFAYAEVCTR